MASETNLTRDQPVKRAAPLSPADRSAIQYAYLTEPGVTMRALAMRFKTNKQTVCRCLRGEDFVALKKRVQEELAESARDTLKRNVVRAAEKWADEAIEKSAKRGDYRAMMDLLKATGVIIQDSDEPKIVVQIGVKLAGGLVVDGTTI